MNNELFLRVTEMIEIMLNNEQDYYLELEHAYEIQQSLEQRLDTE